MRDTAAAVGGVSCPTLPRRLSAVLATVFVPALLVGAAYSGPRAQEQQAAQQKTTAEDELKMLRQKAERGDATAQTTLGAMYAKGEGVPKDDEQAVAWYRRAAEQGYAEAELRLGTMYETGRGVPQDYVQTMALWRDAAEQGDARAQFDLSALYFRGRGVPQDYVQAATWCRKAAQQGHPMAQYHLGTMYADGHGVPQDKIEAHKWVILAAALSSGDQQKAYVTWRDEVARKMTPAQVAEAQRRATEWMATFEKRKK